MTAGKRATKFRACSVWGEMTDRGFEKILAIHGVTAFLEGLFSLSGREMSRCGGALKANGRSLAEMRFYGLRHPRQLKAIVAHVRATMWTLFLSVFEATGQTKILRLIGDSIVAGPIERNGRNRLPC
jgi:hypothetical protein